MNVIADTTSNAAGSALVPTIVVALIAVAGAVLSAILTNWAAARRSKQEIQEARDRSDRELQAARDTFEHQIRATAERDATNWLRDLRFAACADYCTAVTALISACSDIYVERGGTQEELHKVVNERVISAQGALFRVLMLDKRLDAVASDMTDRINTMTRAFGSPEGPERVSSHVAGLPVVLDVVAGLEQFMDQARDLLHE